MVRALEISEARLRLQGAGAAQPVWIGTRSGRVVYANERWRAYFGVRTPPDGWAKWLALLEPEDAPSVLAHLQSGLGGTAPFRLDCRLRRHDGAFRWHQINALPLRDARGSIARFFCVNTDTHELRECDIRVGAALEAANTGIWEWDVASDAVSWTPKCYEIHGTSEAEFPGTGEAFFKLVHEDDRARVQLALQTALNTRGLYECEFRIVRPSGEVVWVENLGRASYDSRGKPVSVQGTLTDIDQRKRAEDEQRARERALQTLADHSPDIISRFDRSLRHVFINAAIERLTGQPRTAFLGKTNRDLGMPAQLCELWERALERVFETGEAEQIEFSIPTPEGERTFCSRLIAERPPGGPVESVLVIAHDVTDRRRAELALSVSEERLQRAQRAAHIGTWDWNVVTGQASWTPEAWRLFGHEPFSRPVTFELWIESVHPEDRASAAQAVQAALRTGRYHDEFRVQYRDGSVAQLEADAEAVLVDGKPVRLVGTVRDITARHEAHQALQSANRKLVAARENALRKRDIVAKVAAASSTIQILEAFAVGLLQLGARAVTCWEVSPSSASLLVERGPPLLGEEPGLRPQGPPQLVLECAQRWTSVYDQPRVEANSMDGAKAVSYHPLVRNPSGATVIVIAYDEALDEELEAALEQLCGQVAEALRRAELSTRLLEQSTADRRLMAIVSHDLRNPLNTVSLATSLLRSGEAVDAAALIQRIERATRLATSLVNDLLTFTRIDTSGLELSLSPTRMGGLLEACAADAAVLATAGRKVTLELNTPDDPTLMVDAGRIQQAVGNLLSNALTYSRRDTTIILRGSADPHAYYIEVENRGASIAPAEAARIFEPLARLGAVGQKGSLGLGLFIVDRIVETHQGRVWVEPAEPDGVRFCIQLPREQSRAAAKTVSLSTRKPSQPPARLEALDADFESLASCFQRAELRFVLEVWERARRGNSMPHPRAFDAEQLRPYLPDMVTVDVSLDPHQAPVFCFVSIGARLERRLHGTLTGSIMQPTDSAFGAAQYAAYRRVWQRRECNYDYVSQRRAVPFGFERLLLPLSRDGGQNVTQILGIILFK